MRILSLDWDSAFQRDLVLELEAAGHQVERRGSAGDALTSAAQRPFGLIVCETRLPDKNGLQFLRELKAAHGREAPPVVFLTAVEDREIRELCLKEGARRFLLKQEGWPTTVAEIHGVIAELEPPTLLSAVDAPRPEARVFRGNLETIEILDIIQLLNLGKKTGVLVLAGGVLDGRIVFDAGEIIDARNHDEGGVTALRSLLALKRGTFRFEPGAATTDRTIHQATASLLLDTLRLQDEGERPARAAGPGSPDEDAAFDFEHHQDTRSEWLYSGLTDEASLSPGEPPGIRPPLDDGDEVERSPFAAAASRPVEPKVPEVLRPTRPGVPERPLVAAPAPPEALISAPVPPASRAASEADERAPAAVPPLEAVTGTDAQPRATARPEPASGTVLLKGGGRRGSGLRVRLHGARRTATLSAAAAVALLASGYVVFFSNVIHGPAEAMESGDYRRLMLEAAANQAKIDSLEQVVGNLTRSVQSGDVSQADANQQISALQSEIQQAAASLDVARKAADAQLDEDQRGDEKKESKSQSESRGEPLPGGSDGAAAAPGAAPDSGPARPLVETMPAVTEPSPPGSDSVSGGDAAAFGSAPLEPETVSVVSVDVEPMTALPAAASSGGDGGGPEEPAPETRAPAAADYGLAAIRRSPTFVPVDAHPKPRSPLRPKYPPALAERKIGGTVTLWVLVNVGGLVEDVRVLRSSGQPELDKAAMDAIRRSPYDPASRDGVAVPAWTQQRIAFKLD